MNPDRWEMKTNSPAQAPHQGADRARDGFVIRRNAIETGVNVLTAIDTAKALITSLENTDIRKLTLIDIAKIKNGV